MRGVRWSSGRKRFSAGSLAVGIALVSAVLQACSFDTSGLGLAGQGDGGSASLDAGAAAADAFAGMIDAGQGRNDGGSSSPIDAAIPRPDAAIPRPDAAPPPLPDRDGDGVLDLVDNCIAVANPDQHDEDGDAIGDVCDNCPHISNLAQRDRGELERGFEADGVGDACDPRPTRPGDSIAFFDGFHAALADRWTVARGSIGGWFIENDRLVRRATGEAEQILYWNAPEFGSIVVETTVRHRVILPAPALRSAGLVASTVVGPSVVFGYACMLRGRGDRQPQPALLELHNLGFDTRPDSERRALASAEFPWPLTAAQPYRLRLASDSDATDQRCGVEAGVDQWVEATSDDMRHDGGKIGLRTLEAAVAFDYIIIYAVAGPLD